MTEFVEIEAAGLDEAAARLNALAEADLRVEGLSIVGALIESQTRARIQAGGPAPDGAAWADWSPAYAAERAGDGGGKLFRGGDLMDSLAFVVAGEALQVGSNLVYAAIQQLGGTIRAKGGGKLRIPTAGGGAAFVDSVEIPARPYLGVSAENAAEIEETVAGWISGVLQ